MTQPLSVPDTAGAVLPRAPQEEWLCPGVVALHTAGLLVAAHEPALSASVRGWLQAGLDTLVLELTGVDRVDARGAVALVEYAHRAEQLGSSLRLVPSPVVQATLTALELMGRFVCVPSVRHARVVTA